MEQLQKIKAWRFKMVSVGIDISKDKSTVRILKPYGEVVISPHEINRIEAEMADLISRISLLEGEVRVIMEATGAYHFPVLHRLKEAGAVCQCNQSAGDEKICFNGATKGQNRQA